MDTDFDRTAVGLIGEGPLVTMWAEALWRLGAATRLYGSDDASTAELGAMLKGVRPVIVCASGAAAAGLTERALAANCHVLVDGPFATLEEALAIERLAQAADRAVVRSSHRARVLRPLLEALGGERVETLSLTWRRALAVDPLAELLPAALELALAFVPPAYVTGIEVLGDGEGAHLVGCGTVSAHVDLRIESGVLMPWPMEEKVRLTLGMAWGRVEAVVPTFLGPRLDRLDQRAVVLRSEAGMPRSVRRVAPLDPAQTLRDEAHAWLSAVRGDGPFQPARDRLQLQTVLDAAGRAAATGELAPPRNVE